MSHSPLCHLTWPPATRAAQWGLTGGNRCKSWEKLEGQLTTESPSVFKTNHMCWRKNSITTSSNGSISALPFSIKRGRAYPTLMITFPFLPVPGTGFAPPEPLLTVFTRTTQWLLASLPALVNTTWETTSARDGILHPRRWLPHLLLTSICPCWTMQILPQMLGIQLNARITKSTGKEKAALCYLVWSTFEEISNSAAWQLWVSRQTVSRYCLKKQNKIYAAHTSYKCILALRIKVELIFKGGRQGFNIYLPLLLSVPHSPRLQIEGEANLCHRSQHSQTAPTAVLLTTQ